MKKALFFALIALVSASCEKATEPIQPKGRQMHFGSVKEAALPEGTRIGLYVGSPVNYTNELLTVDASGAITSANELYWQSEQTQRSSIFAYSPYRDGATSDSLTLSVKTDQSKAENFNASDAIAYFNAAVDPNADSININFTHLFSRIELYFDNRTESKISSVEIGEVATSVRVDLQNANLALGNEKSTVSCLAGTKSYYAVIPPQTKSLKVKVTLEDSTVFEYELDEEDFKSGSSYDNEKSPLKVGKDAPKKISLSFSVSDWADGGELHLKGEEDDTNYDTIASLTATATTTSANFEVNLKNAVVTYKIGNYAHLEDASGAVVIFCENTLASGDILTGTISGKIKSYNGTPQITSIDFSKATKATATEIPLTTLTISELSANYDRYISARILLKNVTITKGTKSGNVSARTGEISQGGSTFTIYASYSTSPAVLEAGLTGDLIAFPAYYNATMELLVYEASQFSKGAEAEAEQTVFAQNTTAIGFYTDTADDAPVASIIYRELKDQVATSVTKTGRTFSLASLEDNSWCMLSLDMTNPKIGATGTATFVSSTTPSTTYEVKVVNKTSTQLWLEDKTALVGFIIAL